MGWQTDMVRTIIKAVDWMPERHACIQYLKRNLPDAEWCMDEKKSALDTLLRALEMAGDDPCLHLEEDIFLTTDFERKAEAAIAEHPDSLIQFFSMRKADREQGSRWDRDYLMNQCFYAPAGYSAAIRAYYEEWSSVPGQLEKNANGSDTLVRDFLKDRKEQYWIHCPSLVDHRSLTSAIDKRRAKTNRQSFTFKDPVWAPGC